MFSGLFDKAKEWGSNMFHLGQKAVKNLSHIGKKAIKFSNSNEFNDIVDAFSKLHPSLSGVTNLVNKGKQHLAQGYSKVKQLDKFFGKAQNASKRWDNTDPYHHGQRPSTNTKNAPTIEKTTPRRLVHTVHDGDGFFGNIFTDDTAPSTRSNINI